MGFIYKITNLNNNKVYIGQTIRSIEQRWSEHKHTALKETNTNYPLYNAIRKYGIDSFKIEMIEECDDSILNEREKFWIQYFNSHGDNGYNVTDGGETVSKKLYKPVQQINFLTGEIINVFPSIREAERRTGIPNQRISMICNGKGIKTGEYTWKFVDEKDRIQIESLEKDRKIYCVELNKYFKTVAEAARFIHQTRPQTSIHTIDGHIRRAIKKNIRAYNYKWEEK